MPPPRSAIPFAGKDVNGTGQLFEEMREALLVRGFAKCDDLVPGIATQSPGACNIELDSS